MRGGRYNKKIKNKIRGAPCELSQKCRSACSSAAVFVSLWSVQSPVPLHVDLHLSATTKFKCKHSRGLRWLDADAPCITRERYNISSLVILPPPQEQSRAPRLHSARASTIALIYSLWPFFCAKLISETNLFGMAVQAIDTNSCLEDTPAGTLDELFIKEQIVKHWLFSFQQHGGDNPFFPTAAGEMASNSWCKLLTIVFLL